MVLKNNYTRALGHQNVKKNDTLFAFAFSSDIRDWMPKVAEKRQKSRDYNALTGPRKRSISKL